MRAEAGWSSGTGSGGGCEAKSVIVVRGEGGCGWNGAYTYECKWVSESSDAEMLKLGSRKSTKSEKEAGSKQ